jgi:hypothetical protein
MKKLSWFLITFAMLIASCDPLGNDPTTQLADSSSTSSLSSGPYSQSMGSSTVTLTDGSTYTITSSVSWSGSTTTWTYTVTANTGAKNISHVSLFGFDNCFWNNLTTQGVSLGSEGNTGCFSNQSTQVIKFTPVTTAEERSYTITFTFGSALGVNNAAATIFVKAGSSVSGSGGCSSVAIPGPSCEVLGISGSAKELICDGFDSQERAYAGATVTATQGTEVRTATTDANGNYSFANAGGTWIVSLGSASQGVTVGPGSAVANFSTDNRPNGSCAAITGSVEKLDCDGTTSVASYANITVTGSGSLGTTTTDSNGNFAFNNVADGTYTITVGIQSASVTVANSEGEFSTGKITVDNRINSTCAAITVHADLSQCLDQRSTGSQPWAGATVTATNGTITLSGTTDANGNVTFSNVVDGSYSVTVSGEDGSGTSVTATQSANVAGPSGSTALSYSFDTTDNGACGSTPACSLSQGYWFAKPQAVWPNNGTVTLGGKVYTQAEGKAIWNSSNKGGILNAKKAFTQATAIKLSNVAPSASVWADVAIIDAYFASIPKISATSIPANSKTGLNAQAGAAAGRIGNWIDANHCNESN